MAVEGPSQAFHGGAVGARVAAILDGANRDAAALEAAAEDAARARLAEAHEEARHAFQRAAEAAREVALERARTLAEMRRSIAERCESLIAEADDPDHVREQIESLLMALAETETLLTAGAGATREPTPPAVLRETADRRPQTAERTPEAEEAPPRPATPFGRWQRNRHDSQLFALLRMAVGGMTREQLESELDPALGPAEREALLDDVFGAPEKVGQRADGNGSKALHAATNRT
jgi:hypothetical protein